MHKKIITIDPLFSSYGGGQIIAYNTYLLLRENGYESYYWAMDKKPYFEPNYEYAQYFTKLYWGVHDYVKNPIKYYYNYQAKKDLDKFVKDIQPDLIHIHGIFGLSSSIFASCKNIPTVMTLHDASLICPATTLLKGDRENCNEHYCKGGTFNNCIKYKCCKGKLEPSIRHFILSHINLKNLKNVNKFITPSGKLKEYFLRANIGLKDHDIVVINNFLQGEEYNIKPNYNNKNYFLYIGRLSKEKGIHYLLQAMKVLPNDIKLHIVGKGVEENNLKLYARQNNLDNVAFLGYKNRAEIKEEYQNCIATILPCNWFENFPTTNMGLI